MSEWKEIVLGEVINTNQSSINRDYPFSDILYLDTGSITRNRISSLQKFSLSEAPSRAKRLVKDLDIIFSSVRPNQLHYGIIRNPAKNLVVSTGFVVISCIKHKIAPYYLYYYLSQSNTTKYLHSIAEGSTSAYPSLKPGDIETFRILLPPLPEQRVIASVLSSLDDKIDLLHRQNHTLEQMAETLFREWFVPARAVEPLADGEETNEGWEETTLYDAIELVGGGTPKTSVEEYWNGGIKWLSGGDIATNHKSIVTESQKSITEKGLNNSSAKLLPKFSTVISARGTVGKYCILSESMTYSQSNYGIKPKFKDCFFFTYLLVNHSVEELNSAAYGSVFDTITTNTFKGLEITIPSEEEIQSFEKKVKEYFFKILNNQTQIRTLTALRDTLLPKLMSGEVRVTNSWEASKTSNQITQE